MDKAKKTSQYYGVRKSSNRYSVNVIVNNVRIYLGHFKNELEAAHVYDNYIRKNNLSRRLNFPDPEPENLIPNTRLVRLTQGKFAIVDEEDFERVNQYNWSVSECKHIWYARRAFKINGKTTMQSMHSFIIGNSDLFTDHRNGNGLHNYKSNLRECTHTENQRNRKIQKSKSKHKGVMPVRNVFRSRIRVDKELIHLGYFKSEIEAAKAYDTAAKKYFGEFARTNF